MKNNFLLGTAAFLLFLLAAPDLSQAQSTFGVQGGLHLSDATVVGPTPYVTSSQGNFFAGVTARSPLNARWALLNDAQYTKRGFFFYPFYSNMSDSRIGVQLIYIDLASRVEYNVFKNIHLQFGLYSGYRLTEYDQLLGFEQWTKPANPISNTWDLGLQAGVAARFQRWTAFLRYSHGMKTIGRLELTDENGTSQGHILIYNKGLQVGTSYAIF